ncbi:MAG: GDP-mannose 4,6-dehydratase [Candidatus Brocadiae bacterium]|nr:GDP-mannose 4,6-dehydratase [Candidatus Brocadiia bacterium]
MRYVITGTAGFIGFHLALSYLKEGAEVVGIDSFTPYYPVVLKQRRHEILKEYPGFTEEKLDLCDIKSLERCFQSYSPDTLCHLAAQPGIRYSMKDPFSYQKSNLEGFVNLLEMARKFSIKRFVYASSSSVYGNVKEVPYKETQNVDTPISLYAATKRANEILAYTYQHLYSIQTIGLRFFTVYGPWGRPDMAIWKFTDALKTGKEIEVFNHGNNFRDFTYIDDIVSGIRAALSQDNLSLYEIFNLGNHQSENVMKLLELLENATQCKAKIRMIPLQPGDMVTTFADIENARQKLGYVPKTSLAKGIESFVSWYRENEELVRKVREIGCMG